MTGIPAFNTSMARWFQEQGWDVEVCTGIPHYPWWKVPEAYRSRDYRQGRGDEVLDGVRVRRVHHYVPAHPITGLKRMALDFSYLLSWTRRLLRHPARTDAVIAVAPPFMIGYLAMLASRRSRAPWLYHIQDLQVDAAIGLGMLPRPLLLLLQVLERIQVHLAPAVSACGAGMRERLAGRQRTDRPPPSLLPNWVDCRSVRPSPGVRNQYREQLGIDPGTCLVGYSGGLGRKHGLDTLFSAAGCLGDHPSIAFLVSGAGSEQHRLALIAQDLGNLTMIDLQPDERLVDLLCAADIHVIPQLQAAADLVMPSKLLNILAVGRPVIATAAEDTELARAIRKADCGLVVPPENPRALADAIGMLAADPERRRRMGAAGREWVERHRDRDTVLGLLERRLLRMIRARRRDAIPHARREGTD